jgi:hypothetical protein
MAPVVDHLPRKCEAKFNPSLKLFFFLSKEKKKEFKKRKNILSLLADY